MKDCREKIIGIFNEHCISNYNLNYYPEIFGNVVCEFEYNEKKYCIVTDRGEIILNAKSIKVILEIMMFLTKHTYRRFRILKYMGMIVVKKE